jgi:hypothetical protein
MEFLKQVWDYFKGKKTFITGALMIVLGFMQGDNQMIMEGIGFITLRSALK